MTGDSTDASCNDDRPYVVEPLAAEEYEGDRDCQYEECENTADWLVEVTAPGKTKAPLLCCQQCSVRNRIYADENDLDDSAVSEEVRADV